LLWPLRRWRRPHCRHRPSAPERYAIFFEPGTYGSAADPLIFQVGYCTQFAGLGAQPGDVTIDGAVDVFNQCPAGRGACEGLDNFWRSLSNLTLADRRPRRTRTRRSTFSAISESCSSR